MLVFELTALFMIGVYVVTQGGRPDEKRRLYVLLLLTAFAGWLSEETSIRLYGFYHYNPIWRLFIFHLPVLVLAVWPIVIHLAWELASQVLGSGSRWTAPVAAGIILTDAALIEVVAVHCGWWVWSRPGLFHVPLIGIFGWAYFAFFCFLFFQKAASGRGKRAFFLLAILPVLGTHLLLLVSWWGFFRWFQGPVAPAVAVGAAWVVSLALAYFFMKKRTGRRLKAKTLLWRFPAALFFYILLSINADGQVWLVGFALAFAPPYLMLFYDAIRQLIITRSLSAEFVGK